MLVNVERFTFFIESQFKENPNGFSLTLQQTENLFALSFEDNDDVYYSIHNELRKCGVEFLYMKKSNRCGFMRLKDINFWPVCEITNQVSTTPC